MTRPEKVVRKLTEHESTIWNALMLAASGLYVFPVTLTDARLKPSGTVKATKRYPVKWSEAASTDRDTVLDMFEQFQTAAIGIATGPSGVVVIDLDEGSDVAKSGRDSVAYHGLDLGKPGFAYPTIGGGEHLYYRADPARPVKTMSAIPAPSGSPMPNVDTRGIGGMLVYYGPRLEAKLDVSSWATPPLWLPERTAAALGQSSASFDAITSRYREPDAPYGARVAEAVKAVKRHGMHHNDVLVLTNELAKLGRDGHKGVRRAMAEARERWAGSTDNPEYHGIEWDKALENAVQTFEAPMPLIVRKPLMPPAHLPEPVDHRLMAPADVTDAALVANGPADARAAVVILSDKKPKRLPFATPDDFFVPRVGVDAAMLARYVNEHRDIGVGVDGLFYVYEGGVWRAHDDIVRDRLTGLLGPRYRREHVGMARDMLAGHAKTARITGEPIPDFVNVRNGMLDWRTLTLHPHAAAYRSTVQLDVSYTPGAPTPIFDAYLDLVTDGDEEMRLTLMEVVAYTAYSGNPFQVATMLHGVANGGKSMFINMLERIAGPANVSHITPEQMEERFFKAGLLGRLLNTQGEYEGKRVQSTNTFKSIVGGDEIEAEHKGTKPFRFRPWAYHVFAGNEFDLTSDTTEGYYRRWHVIEFRKRIRELVTWSVADYFAEADAVFSRAVMALPEMIKAGKFTETVHTMEAAARMRTESDSAALWLHDDEHIVSFDPSFPTSTKRAHLYSVYRDWCERSGNRPMSNQMLYKRLARLGFFSFKGKEWHVRGIEVDTLPLGALAGDDERQEREDGR